MLRVIRKDLIMNRAVLLINAVIFGACLIFVATLEEDTPPKLYAGFASLMMAFLPATMVTREDKFNAMALGCSLPVRRKTVVRARFALSVGMALVGILGSFLLGAFIPHSSLRASDLFSWDTFLTGMSAVTIILALLLPFTLRFGMKGILTFLVATQVLGVVLLTLTRVTASNADKAVVERIIGAVLRLHEVAGPVGFHLLLAGFLLGLLTASYHVSVRAFEMREL